MAEQWTLAPIPESSYVAYAAEVATLSDAKLVKKVRHLERTIKRGCRTGFLQRTIDHLVRCREIALAEALKRGSAARNRA